MPPEALSVVVAAGDLAREVKLALGAIDDRKVMAILGSVLLEAAGDVVRVTATDLSATFQGEVKPLGLMPPTGVVAIPAARLHQLIAGLPPSTELRLTGDEKGNADHHVTVASKTPKLRARLVAHRAEDFPTRPEVGEASLTLPFGQLRRMVERVRYATGRDPGREQMHGALLEPRVNALRMVATDAVRMAIVETPCLTVGRFQPLILPKALLTQIMAIDGQDETPCSLAMAGGIAETRDGKPTSHLSLTIGSRRLFARLWDVKFPGYERVTKSLENEADVNRQELLDAARRVKFVTEDDAATLTFSSGRLTVSAQTHDGDGEQEVPLDYRGPTVTQKLDLRALMQFLAANEGEVITLQFSDQQLQCYAKPADIEPAITRYSYVLALIAPAAAVIKAAA